MSYVSEKVAYLDGLADGLGIEDEKEGKLLLGIIDALSAIAEELEEQNETLDDLSDCVDEIYNELDTLDETFYGDDEDDEDDFDGDDFFEVVCPSCGETIYFGDSMLDSDDGLICPCCNEPIDFDMLGAGADEVPGGDEPEEE